MNWKKKIMFNVLEHIDHSQVTIQFTDTADRIMVKCPYNQKLTNAIKSNMVKDEIKYYEWDSINKQWVIYLWQELWPMEMLFNLLWCFFPNRRI